MKTTILSIFLAVTLTLTVAGQNTRAAGGIQTAEFRVGGNCGMCKARIERVLLQNRGVVSAMWNPATGKATVKYKPSKTTPEQLKQTLCTAGHDTEQCAAADATYTNLPACCHYRTEGAH
jgi:copper chaperone CopZ